MKNNGSFKTLGKGLSSEYQDGIKIYLESSEDEYIIGRKWFSQLKDKISFESVAANNADGGCRLVLKKVQESNKDNKKAFGIIDRDILLADPNFQDSLWWEIDNHIFSSSEPYGKYIFVLHKWELENYLLHPDTLAALVADKKLADSPGITASAIAELLIQHEKELIAVTLLSTVPAKTGKNQEPEQFGRGSLGDELIGKINRQLNLPIDDFILEQEKISRFAEEEINAIDRWNKLSRMLDGKRIMHHIDHLFSCNYLTGCRVSLKSERGALAGYIANQKLIDIPLSNWIEDIYNIA